MGLRSKIKTRKWGGGLRLDDLSEKIFNFQNALEERETISQKITMCNLDTVKVNVSIPRILHLNSQTFFSE